MLYSLCFEWCLSVVLLPPGHHPLGKTVAVEGKLHTTQVQYGKGLLVCWLLNVPAIG